MASTHHLDHRDAISIAEGDVDYELSGNELTVLTSDLEGTYQK